MSRAADRLDALPALDLPGGLTVRVADAWRARRDGLVGLDALPRDTGLWIRPCRSIHTVGMRFPLDLVWLDEDGAVAAVTRDVPPRRLRSQLRAARSVIEVRTGDGERFAEAWRQRLTGAVDASTLLP